MVGSGQFGTPLERMHWAKFRMSVIACCTRACGQSPDDTHCPNCWSNDPVFGSRDWQALWAVWSWELLTPKCCASPFGSAPLLSGSGKFGTPWVRMQAE
jgi:hypothetical protein